MTGRYVRTGAEHPLRVHGHPTSQEEMRFNAGRALIRGESSAERGQAASILVLLDLLEATQDTLEFQYTLIRKAEDTAEAAGRLCYEVAAS